MSDQAAPDADSPVWFVTGAASGFGRAIVEHVAGQGCPVVATARDPSRLADLAEAFPDLVLLLPLDVASPDQVRAAVAGAQARFGRIDVLVNNAGYGFVAAVEEGEEDEVRPLFETHVFGPIDLTKAVLPGMRARRRGHVLNFSSIAAIGSGVGVGYYAAAKAAVEGLSRSLAKELAPLGVQVTIVEPGPFQTGFFANPSRMGRGRIEDYAGTVGAYRQAAAGRATTLPGDPARAAKALFEVALKPDAPVHLLLGGVAHAFAVAEFGHRLEEAQRWRALSESADFPEWAGKPWP